MSPAAFLRRLFRVAPPGSPTGVVDDPPVASWERDLATAEAGAA